MDKSAFQRAKVLPVKVVFPASAQRMLVLPLHLLPFGRKFLSREDTFLEKQLGYGIQMDDMWHQEFQKDYEFFLIKSFFHLITSNRVQLPFPWHGDLQNVCLITSHGFRFVIKAGRGGSLYRMPHFV